MHYENHCSCAYLISTYKSSYDESLLFGFFLASYIAQVFIYIMSTAIGHNTVSLLPLPVLVLQITELLRGSKGKGIIILLIAMNLPV